MLQSFIRIKKSCLKVYKIINLDSALVPNFPLIPVKTRLSVQFKRQISTNETNINE